MKNYMKMPTGLTLDLMTQIGWMRARLLEIVQSTELITGLFGMKIIMPTLDIFLI